VFVHCNATTVPPGTRTAPGRRSAAKVHAANDLERVPRGARLPEVIGRCEFSHHSNRGAGRSTAVSPDRRWPGGRCPGGRWSFGPLVVVRRRSAHASRRTGVPEAHRRSPHRVRCHFGEPAVPPAKISGITTSKREPKCRRNLGKRRAAGALRNVCETRDTGKSSSGRLPMSRGEPPQPFAASAIRRGPAGAFAGRRAHRA
jgi:hypothetical protein